MRQEIKAARLRQHDAVNQQIYLAWQIEAIKLQTKETQSGKNTMRTIVKLQKVLMPEPTDTPDRAATVHHLRAQLVALSSRYRIPLRRHRRGHR